MRRTTKKQFHKKISQLLLTIKQCNKLSNNLIKKMVNVLAGNAAVPSEIIPLA